MEGNIIKSCFELFEMFFEEKNSSNKQFKTASKASIESHGWGGRHVIPKFSILVKFGKMTIFGFY